MATPPNPGPYAPHITESADNDAATPPTSQPEAPLLTDRLVCVYCRHNWATRYDVSRLPCCNTCANQKTRRIVGTVQAVGRNERCPCGSGQKYKKCCSLKNRG